jgi:hypothetical protein
MQPEQSVRTLPFALALAKDAAIPIQALEIEETLAHMTMASNPVVYLSPADKSHRLTRRLSQEQKGL